MKNYLSLLFLVLLVFMMSPSTAAGAEVQVYPCHLLSKETVLDGNLDEIACKSVLEGTGFVKLGSER